MIYTKKMTEETLDESIFEGGQQQIPGREEIARDCYLQMGRGRSIQAVKNVTGYQFDQLILWSQTQNWAQAARDFDQAEMQKYLGEGHSILGEGKRDPMHARMLSDMTDLLKAELPKYVREARLTQNTTISPTVLLRGLKMLIEAERLLHGQTVPNTGGEWTEDILADLPTEDLERLEAHLRSRQ
jgi:hypothetical protein